MSRSKRTTAASAAKPAAKPAAGRAAAPERRPQRTGLVVAVGVALVSVLFIGSMVFAGMRQNTAERQLPLGLACGGFPSFVRQLGFSPQASFDTSDTRLPGVRLIEQTGAHQPPHVFQDPSWTQAGFLGSGARDAAGNYYYAPAPQTSLIVNPPEKQNWIYKLDATTGKLAPLINVPSAQPPPPENPYGILGLAVDCRTNSLYAASVLGSNRQEERGRIVRVDLRSGQITSQIDGIDGYGLTVARDGTVPGGRLYLGRARIPEVWSVQLDQDGNLRNAPVREFALGAALSDSDGRAHRLRLVANGTLEVTTRTFAYTLVPPSTPPQTLNFTYNATDHTWSFRPVP